MLTRSIILAVDQGARSGWALFRVGKLVASGVATKAAQRKAAVDRAVALSRITNMPLVFVYEDHSGIPARKKGNTRTLLGMGAARGRWEEQLDMAGVPKPRRLKVRPETWRRNVLGLRLFTPRDVAKTAAIRFVVAAYGVDAKDDEAEAVCIGHWGCRTPFGAATA